MNLEGNGMVASDKAVMLLGFGGPSSFKEVRTFIYDVTHGRNVPQDRIETVVEQYKAIGGKSPFKELTKRQALALQVALAEQGLDIPVVPGFLYCSPYINETIKELVSNKVSYIVAIVMAPHRTEASFDRYVKAVEQACNVGIYESVEVIPYNVKVSESIGMTLGNASKINKHAIQIEFVPAWHTHPMFIEALLDRIQAKLSLILQGELKYTQIIFTAHSVPIYMSEKSLHCMPAQLL